MRADSDSRGHEGGLVAVFPAVVLLAVLAMGPSAWAQSDGAATGGGAAGFAGASAAAPADSMPGDATAAAGVGTIEGVAVSGEGEVYQGVRVVLAGMGPNSGTTMTQTTDTDGAFKFTNVSPGAFRLTLTSAGFATQMVTGTVHAGETFDAHDVVMTMATASSDVHVTASREDIAQAQIKIEETQRVLGIVPNFYVTYDHNAVPLTTRQKWQLTWRSDVDVVTIATTGLIAGIQLADNALPGYGRGAQGYAKRFGAGYANTVTNTFIGSAILPTLLKQDPRYFYKGTGSVNSRIWYALANSVICKGDNGRWQPNYSAIVGGLASGAIANLYYPSSDIGWGVTFEGAAIGTATGAIQTLFQEFVVKKLTPGFRRSGN